MMLMIIAVAIVAVLLIASRLHGGPAPGSVASPTPSPEGIKSLIAAGKFVDAIAHYRQLTGLGLYEAKQAVDRMRISGVWEAPPAAASAVNDDAVLALVRENKLIEAIKLYQSKHGVDLSTAKQAVDKLAFGP